ncbi:hypothetical protein VTJ04DRAFT_6004 [Mycothermus thermophilus]|uniref:uncharacterized protein n=1 Tax=Humicola insolens TaxID=85995 RepID=UPI0037423F17
MAPHPATRAEGARFELAICEREERITHGLGVEQELVGCHLPAPAFSFNPLPLPPNKESPHSLGVEINKPPPPTTPRKDEGVSTTTENDHHNDNKAGETTVRSLVQIRNRGPGLIKSAVATTASTQPTPPPTLDHSAQRLRSSPSPRRTVLRLKRRETRVDSSPRRTQHVNNTTLCLGPVPSYSFWPFSRNPPSAGSLWTSSLLDHLGSRRPILISRPPKPSRDPQAPVHPVTSPMILGKSS